MSFYLNITYSKIIALLVLILAFVMDIMNDRNGTVFMYCLPFVVTLITGKQFLDKNKHENVS